MWEHQVRLVSLRGESWGCVLLRDLGQYFNLDKISQNPEAKRMVGSAHNDAYDLGLIALHEVEPNLNPTFFLEHSERVHNLSVNQHPPVCQNPEGSLQRSKDWWSSQE